MKATFSKEERLCSQKVIQELFEDSNSFVSKPFRVVWKARALPTTFPAQVVISVPKKRIRGAVQRNKVKRLIREAYRTNKSIHYPALEERGVQLAIMIIYLGREVPSYAHIRDKIIVTLQRLIKDYDQVGSTDDDRVD